MATRYASLLAGAPTLVRGAPLQQHLSTSAETKITPWSGVWVSNYLEGIYMHFARIFLTPPFARALNGLILQLFFANFLRQACR